MGHVNAVQLPKKLWDDATLWHNLEKDVVRDKLQTGEVTGLNIYTVNKLKGIYSFK